MRRVTVVTPHTRLDLSLPPRGFIAELVPQLVRLSAAQARTGVAAGGWELRRLSGPALPPSSTVDDVGIRDGELLYLDPATPQARSPVFDDVVDAIAGAAADRGAWHPGRSRLAGAVATALAFVATAVLLGAALPRPAAPVACAGLAVALLAAAGAAARPLRDPAVGAALATGGLASALATGLEAGGTVTAGLTAAAGYAVLAAIVVAGCAAWFAGAAFAGGTGAAAAAVTASAGFRPAATAAVVVVCAISLSPVLPALALRLSRLPLPRVPADMTAFRDDEPPLPGSAVRERTRAAQDALSALLAAHAAVALGAVAVLLRAGGAPWAPAMSAAAGLALVLRARAYLHVAQRGSLLLAGLAALAGTGVRVAGAGGMPTAGGLVGAAVLAGLVSAGYALRAHRGTPSPYWSRTLDVLELVALLGLVPFAAAVLGVFTAVRTWAG
jgi:type VII secretion integral membrane protein EccD